MSKLSQKEEEQSLVFHPYNILLVLAIASLTVMFVTLTIAFTYSRIERGAEMAPISLPPIFLLNTLILLASSGCMIWAKRSYLQDNTENYQKALLYTLILSFIFLIGQFFGWRELLSENIFIATSGLAASYLYLISGLHFMHVIAGLPFLIIFHRVAKKRMKEPVSVLVYFSDPEKRLKLKILTLSWHFLDGLWIYLVIFFFINSII